MRRLLALVAASLTVLTLVAGPGAGSWAATSSYRHHRPHDGQLVVPRFDAVLDDLVAIVANSDGSHAHQIYDKPMECPHWSPDGRLIASCGTPSGDGTTVLDLDTGSSRLLPNIRPGLTSPCFVWSSDQRHLACESWSEADPSRNGIYTVRVRDWRGSRRLTRIPGGDDVPGDFSPHDRALVFSRSDHAGTSLGLYVVHLASRRLTRLTPPGADVTSPGSWSPHDHRIVFSEHEDADSRGTIWVVHPDGTGLHRLDVHLPLPCGGAVADPLSNGCAGPVWSPSGRRLVFQLNDATGSHLYVCDADGRHPHEVLDQVDGYGDWGVHPPQSTSADNEDAR